MFAAILLMSSCEGGKGGHDSNGGKLFTDSVYVTGSYQMSGELFHGADGYDYYVAPVYADSLFTYEEALSLEKDGWVLPKSLGHYAITSQGGINGQDMEYKTMHTDSDEPVIERMVGSPRLLVEVLPDLTYQRIAGFGEFWTATPLGDSNAVYYTVRQQFNGTQMSSITDTGDPKSNHKHVVLVKRIERPNTVFYHNPENNRRFPSRNINGYNVVDPSGGLNFIYDTPSTIFDDGHPKWDYPEGIHYVTEYETDGWKLPDYEALGKIFNTAIEPMSTSAAVAATMEVQRMFPPSNRGRHPFYLGRDSQGAFFSYFIEDLPEEHAIRIKTGAAPNYKAPCVRLIKLENGTDDRDKDMISKEEDSGALTTPDLGLFGLKGPVESVSYKRVDFEKPYRTVKFNADGNIIVQSNIKISRDGNDRIVSYAQCVSPDSEDNYEYTIKYEGAANNPLSYNVSSNGGHDSVNFKYDKEGNLIQSRTESGFEGTEDTNETIREYTILSADEYGNWTKRKVEEEIIENYMVENAMGEYSPRQNVRNESYVETRTIEYRNK